MDISDDKLQRTCRTCLMQDQNFHSIFENIGNELKICEMLATVTPQLLTLRSEKLPKQVCKACLNKLNIAYGFQQMCISSEKHLLNAISSDKSNSSNSLSVSAVVKMEPDLLLDQECVKLEDFEEEVRNSDLEQIVQVEQVENDNRNEAEMRLVDRSRNNSDADDNDHDVGNIQDDDDLQSLQTKQVFAQSMHNEMDQECVKLEDDGEEVKNIDLEEIVHSEQVDNENNNEAEMRLLDKSRNNSDAYDNNYDFGNDHDGDLHSSQTKEDCAKSMPNETGVDEIEKPIPRNRRKTMLACPLCDKVFDRPYNLKRHAGVHSPKRIFQCQICNYRFPTVNQLGRHKFLHANAPASLERVIPPDGYKCAECPRRFEKRESLLAHMQSHRKTDPTQTFKCELCPKKFRKFNELTKHASTHPENQKYKCTQCEKTFGVQAHLIEHMNEHKALKPFVCVYCNKAFLQNSTLKEHQRIHTGEKPYLCSQCGKSFKNSSNLSEHLLRHSDERRYQCPECPSKFACHSDQIKHMSTHRAIKPHICDICGSSFTRSYTLRRHKQIHTGERPHKCEECNMTFVFIDHMRRHKRTHTGEKPYKCKLCDRAFADSGDLNKHMRTHVGEKTYICNQCPEAFKYQLELREHQRLHYKQQQQQSVAEMTVNNGEI